MRRSRTNPRRRRWPHEHHTGVLRSFFLVILGIFLFTWVALVVFPWMELGHLPPIQDEEAPTSCRGTFPVSRTRARRSTPPTAVSTCHTQQVRPPTSGADIIRGWGTASDPEDPKRRSRAAPIRATHLAGRDLPRHQPRGRRPEATSRNASPTRPNSTLPLRSPHRQPALQHAGVPLLFVTQKISGSPEGSRCADRRRCAARRLRDRSDRRGQGARRLSPLAQEELSLEAG